MRNACSEKAKNINTIIFLFLCMLLFKFAIDWGCWNLLCGQSEKYQQNFEPLRYAGGMFWCVVLFFAIPHTKKQVSVFLVYLTYLLQIVPMTAFYALCYGSPIYYHLLCLAFLMCELLLWYDFEQFFEQNSFLSHLMITAFFLCIVVLIAECFIKNGLPAFTALDIYRAYEIRQDGVFQISKYANYLLKWSIDVFLPYFIVKSMIRKQYGHAMIYAGMILLLYLYSGNKSFLFSIPVIILCSLWSKRKNFYKEIFACACIGFAVLVLLAIFHPFMRVFWIRAYSLLGKRTLMDPAGNKFFYYDYFSTRPKLGLAGVFPRWLINIPNPYEGIEYQHEIAAIYFNSPETNANTGFLAEGYMRFGLAGIFLIMLLFALILKLADSLQERCGYRLAVSLLICPVINLTDAHLFDSLSFGPWMMMLLLLIFYNEPVSPLERRLTGYRRLSLRFPVKKPRILTD